MSEHGTVSIRSVSIRIERSTLDRLSDGELRERIADGLPVDVRRRDVLDALVERVRTGGRR